MQESLTVGAVYDRAYLQEKRAVTDRAYSVILPVMQTKFDRREFVRLAGTAGAIAITGEWDPALAFQQTAPGPDTAEKDLVLLALDAVKSAGASYADARITHVNSEVVAARERQITNVSKGETY